MVALNITRVLCIFNSLLFINLNANVCSFIGYYCKFQLYLRLALQ